MPNLNGFGGNAKRNSASAKVDFTKKCALTLVPVPKAPAEPRVMAAPTLREALAAFDVTFKFTLRRLDGTTNKEQVAIRSLEDFEEDAISAQTAVLREQKSQMDFLHQFQHELAANAAFAEEMQELLRGENKERLIHFLRGWSGQFRKREPQFLRLLQS